MTLFWWLVIGGLAGWAAGLIMKGRGFGVAGDIVLGIIGAVVGGLIFDFFNVSASGSTGTFVVALIGAVVVLFLASLVKHPESTV